MEREVEYAVQKLVNGFWGDDDGPSDSLTWAREAIALRRKVYIHNTYRLVRREITTEVVGEEGEA